MAQEILEAGQQNLQASVCVQVQRLKAEGQPFFLSRPSTDRMMLTHMMGEQSALQSANLNVNLSQKHPHRNTQVMFEQMFVHPRGPVKLTCKINHCKIM